LSYATIYLFPLFSSGAKGDLAKGIRQSLPLWNMKRRPWLTCFIITFRERARESEILNRSVCTGKAPNLGVNFWASSNAWGFPPHRSWPSATARLDSGSRWRRLNGPELVAKVVTGVKFLSRGFALPREIFWARLIR
jgi:hypothetical protein